MAVRTSRPPRLLARHVALIFAAAFGLVPAPVPMSMAFALMGYEAGWPAGLYIVHAGV